VTDVTSDNKALAGRTEFYQGNGRQHKTADRDGQTPAREDPAVNPTDLGNARRVIKDHGQDLRYCHPWKTWLVWDGRRWREDDTAEALRRVKDTQGRLLRWTLNELAAQGDSEENEKRRKSRMKVLEHCFRWEDSRRMNAALEMARSEPGIPILPAQLDTDPFLFNVLNGTIDLRTGQLREHRREDYLSKLAPVQYDTEARCPTWQRFLERIMEGNTNLITYLQRVTGYALTGDVSEHALFFLYGTGANGKSTFLLALLAMLGDYGIQAVSELLMQRASEQHPTERADLFGRRFVATIETDEGKRMAESLMKQMTGGDRIRARRMREDFWEFSPTHKVFLAANHKPVIRGTDYAVWRRIKLIPFTVTISEEEMDKHLPDKLQAELPGILAWSVRGCRDWQVSGLGEPEEVREATANYQAEQDTIAAFLTECCCVHQSAKCRSSDLLEVYQRWSGDKFITAKLFAQRLQTKGYRTSRGHGGYYCWQGIGLPTAEPVKDGEPS
jgi:putative DNA primase/helicase